MQFDPSPSPNFNERKFPVDMLVLHYTGMASGAAARDRMCDPKTEVSAHYMVWEDGRISQLVSEDKRAWHAGVSTWQGDDDLNSRSIGIEIVNGGHDVPLPDGTLPPYLEAQIAAVITLCQNVLSRHAIPASRIVAHSDIAPARKSDPGEHFPWERLADSGIGIWPATAMDDEPATALRPGESGKAVSRLQEDLKAIGYGLSATGTYDDPTLLTVRAFQRRWRPGHLSGAADVRTQHLVRRVRELSGR
tara:strand:- start:2685 stop:3428 length:744 start_codon:yes stop_codon:yes gene_type:complete